MLRQTYTTYPPISLFFGLCLFLNLGSVNAENVDPDNSGLHYAWSENVGWLNFEPQGDGGPGVDVSDFQLTGYIWGENIGWISLTCENDDSCNQVYYSVLNNGQGELTGYAWGENVGWISFSCDNTLSCANARWGVTIDNDSGRFQGYAWGENIGWLSFSDLAGTGYAVVTSWRPPQQADEDDEKDCFLAAIASGTYLQSSLAGVRQFRDRYLMRNAPGRWVVAWYYRLSPKAIRLVKSHQTLVTVSRWLITPVVYFVTYIKAVLMAFLCGIGIYLRRYKQQLR